MSLEHRLNRVLALGTAQNYMPGFQANISGDFAGMTLDEIMHSLGVPSHAVWFFSIAGKRVSNEYRLGEGEEFTIHSPVDGGSN